MRTGRHTTPSQVEKVAQQAGKAAPVVAVVGTLTAAPQAQQLAAAGPVAAAGPAAHARLDSRIVPAATVSRAASAPAAGTAATAVTAGTGVTSGSVQIAGTAVTAARAVTATRTYRVRRGDTLAGIALRFYGSYSAWPMLYRVNRSVIRNPNLIYVGQVLRVPRHPGADSGGQPGYRPRHGYHPRHGRHSHRPPRHYHGGLHGTLGCSGLEQLWMSAGGARRAAVTAASVAMAESSGRQYATGAAGERGYWQIHPVNGPVLSTYNAHGNARAAVIMSHDGRNWSPWTTYVDGVYRGRC